MWLPQGLRKQIPGRWAETLAKKRTAMHAHARIFTCTHQRFDVTLRRFVVDVLGNHCLNSKCVHDVKRWKCKDNFKQKAGQDGSRPTRNSPIVNWPLLSLSPIVMHHLCLNGCGVRINLMSSSCVLATTCRQPA